MSEDWQLGAGEPASTPPVNWERRKVAKEIIGAVDEFNNCQSGGDAEHAAERLARALDHYIARSSQGWVR